MSNVVYLQKPPPQIAHFLRVGHREHVLCDHLRTVGKLASKRFVFEAGNIAHQKDLIRELKTEGAELVLDTNAAEQSVVGRFAGSVSDAPWAIKDRALERDDFRPNTNRRGRFDASGWLKLKSGGGGSEKKVFIAGLDRRVTVAELKTLFSNSTTARSVFGCRDVSCCSGIDAMLKEPEAHLAVQQGKALADLSRTPESLRPDHFLRSYVSATQRRASRALKLKNVSVEFRKISDKACFRLDRMKDSLEMTSERLGVIDFAPETPLRNSQGKSQSKKGRNQ